MDVQDVEFSLAGDALSEGGFHFAHLLPRVQYLFLQLILMLLFVEMAEKR